MRRVTKFTALIVLLAAAAASHAQTAERTFFVRNRSFTAGAPAGWTTNPYTGTTGSSVINAQSSIARSILRVSGPNSDDLYPNEPTLVARGSVADWANESMNVLDEKAELERAVAELGSSFKDLDANLRSARADVEVRRLRIDFLNEAVRANRIEAARTPTPENQKHLADLTAQDAKATTALLKSELALAALTQQREVSLKGQHDALAANLASNAKQLKDLAGFYASDPIRGVSACAKPWVFKEAPGTPTNPFYPNATPDQALGRQQIAICVANDKLQAVYLLNAEGQIVARSLFGRNGRGELDRIVIRDERGAMLEDHQYLPGPKGMIRYGLTFRTESAAGKNQMTSIYTDLAPR